MIGSTIFAALLAAQFPGQGELPESLELTAQNKAVIRCSAAFAVTAARQGQGTESAKQWPQLSERGREFFVVGLADIMDQHSIDRYAVARLVREERDRLNKAEQVDEVMPACLLMLETSGL